ncbi:hypothetical protein BGP77_11520 [Saccharospirillum sp. MSK14-1]|uniref:hypothetical protein n=1 Tax=Saccharospirillum sp. MSK14-1 TaxID=1897632 RepID=UPI000D3A0922|nr:hypothetical protein [Saccharospirillum sp. MSK14-1]PTY38569.1 hypothetical protein BGP77_11520 [Saccharospirillum sp. MSK14-1]
MKQPKINPNFNKTGCLSIGEYVADIGCPECGSKIRMSKNDECASCEKTKKANSKAAIEFNAKRRSLDLQKEINQIEKEFQYDLMEY